jgi:hypothetical protein
MFFTSFFQIVCAGDERLLQTYGVCDRQRERKLHFGAAPAAFADAMGTMRSAPQSARYALYCASVICSGKMSFIEISPVILP